MFGVSSARSFLQRRSTLTRHIFALLKNEAGATAIEYGLIAALIAVAVIATVTTVGTNLNSTFNSVAQNL
jgi:pilus assembly protein Flp/PilA